MHRSNETPVQHPQRQADPLLLKNATVATMTGDKPYGLMSNAAVALENGLIAWCGLDADIPTHYQAWRSRDLKGRLVTPALIDCHTHLVFGGNRAREFELRLQGASYEELAQAGGGIVSTMRATRESSEQQLLDSALLRADALIAEGVCTIEIKSGYGLDIDTELKMLRVARQLSHHRSIRVRTSFLGAHALPAQYSGQHDTYIDEVCIPALYAAHEQGLVDAVDGFCEGIAFSATQIERVFVVAQTLGLPVKLHAEQLSNLGGAKLAARYRALSADHLEYLDLSGVQEMAAHGTVAVVLPGAFYTLRETQAPPIEALIDHGVPLALATDCNPGSSPLASLLLAMNMACTLFRMTPDQALDGVTRQAARALGLNDCGSIEVGKRADLSIWNIEHPAELAYRIGFNPLEQRLFAGGL